MGKLKLMSISILLCCFCITSAINASASEQKKTNKQEKSDSHETSQPVAAMIAELSDEQVRRMLIKELEEEARTKLEANQPVEKSRFVNLIHAFKDNMA